MASKSGANTGVILRPYLTFDSPSAPSTGNKMRIESEDFGRNTTELPDISVGGQLIMKKDSYVGDDEPSGTINTKLRSDDAFNAAIMSFFGTETTTLVTAGVTEHSAVVNTASIVNYFLYAKETDTANVEEYVNTVMTELGLEFNLNDFVKASSTFKASKRLITGTTATNANITSATEPTNSPFIFRDVDYFRINAIGGAALSNPTDVIPVTQVSVTYSRPYEFVDEARGTAGKAAPRVAGEPPLSCKVTITLKEKDGNTFWTAHDAGTEYKAQLNCQGALISGGNYHNLRLDFPKLKVVTEPKYSLSSTSVNPVTIEFEGFVANTTPTGLLSTYPGIVLKNDKAAKYMA